jgi:NAD(P)H-hydrate epimerase
MKLLLSSWMRELDDKAINHIGIPSIVLMENASQGAANFFAETFPLKDRYEHVIIFIGKGNNGGDGLAVGRILHQRGYKVEFILFSTPGRLNTDPKINFKIIKNLNLNYSIIQDETHLKKIKSRLKKYHPKNTLIIDALLGTGINKPVTSGLFASTIEFINKSGFKVAAIDIPSGLSEFFLPEEGKVVCADATATFQSLKTSHLHPDGNKYCGKIKIIDIGIPREFINQDKYYINITVPNDFEALLAFRELDSHKGNFGHGLTIAGSIEKPGAGILASFALLKSGAGLCTSALCFENRTTVVSKYPEIMTIIYDKTEDLYPAMMEFDCIVAGPGLGINKKTHDILKLLIKQAKVPLVLDADALNVLGQETSLLAGKRPYPLVLTPHPGEFARLTGLTIPEIMRDRMGACRDFAQKFNVYLILKGHHTIIATPEGKIFLNPTGNPGMATAGSGDVLSGMIAGMICQFSKQHSLETILQAAVFIHGYAGDLASRIKGQMALTATDILDFIPEAFESIKLNEYNTPF